MLTQKNCQYKQMKKYLHSRIGHVWDEIHSDLCKLNAPEMNDYVRWLVELKPVDRKGTLYTPDGRSKLSDELYVWNGTLRYMEDKRPYRENTIPEIMWSAKNKQIHKINGVWFEFTVKEYTITYSYHKISWGSGSLRMERSTNDSLMGYAMTRWDREKTYGGMYEGVSKRQLNSKEIKNVKASLQEAG